MRSKIKSLELLISGKKNIVITLHRGPDGDAIGSALGLYNILIQQGHNITVITPNDYPIFLQWMSGNNNVVVFDKESENAISITAEADLIFLLDFNHISRLDDYGLHVKKSKAKKVMIDHHQEPDMSIADIVFSDPNASSTSEIIFRVIDALNLIALVNKDVAECLYTGIMTDTGSFKYPSTTKETHNIVSQLINKGVDNSKIHNLIYDSFSEDRIRLLGYCLNEKLLIFQNNHSAIISLTSLELEKFNFKKGDTEGIINYALAIKGIIFAVFIVERDNLIKVSLRSKGLFKVNKIAKKYFNGGGHINAAGGISQFSIDETILKVQEIIRYYKNELNTQKNKLL